MSREALTEEALSHALGGLPGWEVAGGMLHRELHFADFSEAWGFMNRVALIAETLAHHPNWSNVWSSVVIDLSTHDAGGITATDVDFAGRVNQLLG